MGGVIFISKLVGEALAMLADTMTMTVTIIIGFSRYISVLDMKDALHTAVGEQRSHGGAGKSVALVVLFGMYSRLLGILRYR